MQKIDKIVFGDNQFFGINHMSQEKAQALSEKFYKIENIFKIYDDAIESGIDSIMLNSNDRAKDITTYFKENKAKYGHISWYPSIPYPHKYANLVAEKGIFPAINEVLFKDNSVGGMMNMVMKGGSAVFQKDAIKLMTMLIDVEMRMFKGLDVKVVFLQNIITDLMLGYEVKDVFYEYCQHVRKKYNAIPGLITQNMPLLKSKLEEWGIEEVVICSSFNKIGYLMSPNVNSYVEAIKNNDDNKYQLMAMSTMASGAVPVKEAYEFVNKQNLQSVVFGASSKKHIQETVSLINI